MLSLSEASTSEVSLVHPVCTSNEGDTKHMTRADKQRSLVDVPPFVTARHYIGVPLVDKCRVASGNVASVLQRLTSYHCHQSSTRMLQACAGKE